MTRYPNSPRNGRHVFVVCRLDRGLDGADAFSLTRAYSTEAEAQAKADSLNAALTQEAATYDVRVARLAEEPVQTSASLRQLDDVPDQREA